MRMATRRLLRAMFISLIEVVELPVLVSTDGKLDRIIRSVSSWNEILNTACCQTLGRESVLLWFLDRREIASGLGGDQLCATGSTVTLDFTP